MINFSVLKIGFHGDTFVAMQHNTNGISSLQCYSVLSDILVKNELCIPLERGSNVLSTGEGFICLSPTSKLKMATCISVLSTKSQFRSVLSCSK